MNELKLSSILRDPVTLRPDTGLLTGYQRLGYINARPGKTSNKNDMEAAHFAKSYKHESLEDKSYLRKIQGLPDPGLSPDSTVLDIGCGPYDCIGQLPGRHYYLDDIMDFYVGQLGSRYEGTPVLARTELMPFADQSFDLIYSINMVDHVDDMVETIYELHRVLRDDGCIHMQSYYNSHPLLETEPGVFDRTFWNEYILPNFEVESVRTRSVGGPDAPLSYTMDTVTCVLRKRLDALPQRKSRDRYLQPDYVGPQSAISNVISSVKSGNLAAAEKFYESVPDNVAYGLHRVMLRILMDIHSGKFGPANQAIKRLLTVERVRKNPYARIALLELENRRIALAGKVATTKTPKAIAPSEAGASSVVPEQNSPSGASPS